MLATHKEKGNSTFMHWNQGGGMGQESVTTEQKTLVYSINNVVRLREKDICTHIYSGRRGFQSVK